MSDNNKDLKAYLKSLSYEDLAKLCNTLAEVEKGKEENTDDETKIENIDSIMNEFSGMSDKLVKHAEVINNASGGVLEANVYIGVIVKNNLSESDDNGKALTYACGNFKTLGKYFAKDPNFKEIIEEL